MKHLKRKKEKKLQKEECKKKRKGLTDQIAVECSMKGKRRIPIGDGLAQP